MYLKIRGLVDSWIDLTIEDNEIGQGNDAIGRGDGAGRTPSGSGNGNSDAIQDSIADQGLR
jgi:hypothetical protein